MKDHLARLNRAKVYNAPGEELNGLGPGPVVLARVQLQQRHTHHVLVTSLV